MIPPPTPTPKNEYPRRRRRAFRRSPKGGDAKTSLSSPSPSYCLFFGEGKVSSSGMDGLGKGREGGGG